MCDVDLWEPPMKIEKKYMRECPLVNAVVKNRYSIDYHRGTGGYKAVYVVFSRFFVGFDHVTEITQSLTHTRSKHRYKAYDMKTKRPVCLALFRQPDKDSDPKTRYIEMRIELEQSRNLFKSGLEHQGLLNILDMSEPETPVPIVRGVRTLTRKVSRKETLDTTTLEQHRYFRIPKLKLWRRVKMQTYFLVFISSLSI